MKIKEVIIVEGKNDKLKIESIYKDCDILITDGSSVEKHLDFFKTVSLKRDLILFLDPDYPGEKIRKTIANSIPNVLHCFLKKEKAISKNHKKVGIEHAKKEDIIQALENKLTFKENDNLNKITYNDLYELKLVGNCASKNLRKKVSDYLNIGLPNGKVFLERINMLGVTLEEIKDIIKKS